MKLELFAAVASTPAGHRAYETTAADAAQAVREIARMAATDASCPLFQVTVGDVRAVQPWSWEE